MASQGIAASNVLDSVTKPRPQPREAAAYDEADFLLALHRGDADLREVIVAEIARRAGTGSDPLVAFAPPLAEQDG